MSAGYEPSTRHAWKFSPLIVGRIELLQKSDWGSHELLQKSGWGRHKWVQKRKSDWGSLRKGDSVRVTISCLWRDTRSCRRTSLTKAEIGDWIFSRGQRRRTTREKQGKGHHDVGLYHLSSCPSYLARSGRLFNVSGRIQHGNRRFCLSERLNPLCNHLPTNCQIQGYLNAVVYQHKEQLPWAADVPLQASGFAGSLDGKLPKRQGIIME
jgi:hypothetical protein